MQNRIRIAFALLAATALVFMSVGQPAQAARHAYHNHGRHVHSTVRPASAAAVPVGSACKATEKAGDTINQHVGTWTRSDVEAFIGCAGVLVQSQGTTTTTYGWDDVKGHVLLVTFLNDIVKEPVHYR